MVATDWKESGVMLGSAMTGMALVVIPMTWTSVLARPVPEPCETVSSPGVVLLPTGPPMDTPLSSRGSQIVDEAIDYLEQTGYVPEAAILQTMKNEGNIIERDRSVSSGGDTRGAHDNDTIAVDTKSGGPRDVADVLVHELRHLQSASSHGATLDPETRTIQPGEGPEGPFCRHAQMHAQDTWDKCSRSNWGLEQLRQSCEAIQKAIDNAKLHRTRCNEARVAAGLDLIWFEYPEPSEDCNCDDDQ